MEKTREKTRENILALIQENSTVATKAINLDRLPPDPLIVEELLSGPGDLGGDPVFATDSWRTGRVVRTDDSIRGYSSRLAEAEGVVA